MREDQPLLLKKESEIPDVLTFAVASKLIGLKSAPFAFSRLMVATTLQGDNVPCE